MIIVVTLMVFVVIIYMIIRGLKVPKNGEKGDQEIDEDFIFDESFEDPYIEEVPEKKFYIDDFLESLKEEDRKEENLYRKKFEDETFEGEKKEDKKLKNVTFEGEKLKDEKVKNKEVKPKKRKRKDTSYRPKEDNPYNLKMNLGDKNLQTSGKAAQDQRKKKIRQAINEDKEFRQARERSISRGKDKQEKEPVFRNKDDFRRAVLTYQILGKPKSKRK